MLLEVGEFQTQILQTNLKYLGLHGKIQVDYTSQTVLLN